MAFAQRLMRFLRRLERLLHPVPLCRSRGTCSADNVSLDVQSRFTRRFDTLSRRIPPVTGRTLFAVSATGMWLGIAIACLTHPFQDETSEQSRVADVDFDTDRFDADIAKLLSGPREVVLKQLDAMKAAAKDPNQMVVCYSLASPGNRRQTGPYGRFDHLVRSGVYRPLVGHQTSLVGRAAIKREQAAVTVTVVGEENTVHAYLFVLSLQPNGHAVGEASTPLESMPTVDGKPEDRRSQGSTGTQFASGATSGIVMDSEHARSLWLTDAVIPIPPAILARAAP